MTEHSAETPVLLERSGGVASVRLNRPEALNAMNDQLMDDLLSVLADLAEDRSVRAVVLTGAGTSFSAGGDVKMMVERKKAAAQAPSVGYLIDSDYRNLVRRGSASAILQTMPKPTIAAIRGHVVGGATALALACDFRIAADDTKIRFGFAARGLSGDYGLTYLLEHGVGMFRARELLLLDEPLTADEALREGLVTEVTPISQWEHRTKEFAERLASGPTIAYGRTKANLVAAAGAENLEQFLGTEAMNQRVSAMTADSAESGRAFVERRKPEFRGE